jgi:hypothetical protein
VAKPVIVISFVSGAGGEGGREAEVGAEAFLVKFENIPPMLTLKFMVYNLIN